MKGIVKKTLLMITMLLWSFSICGCGAGSQKTNDETQMAEYIFEDESYIEPNSVERVLNYTYSPEGNIVEISECTNENSEETLHRYKYDDNNNLIEHYYYDCLMEEYTFESGNCIEEKYYDFDGSLLELHKYTYKQGKLSTEYCEVYIFPEVETSDGELTEIEFTEYYYREYNAAGKLVKETCYEYESEPYINEFTYTNNKSIMKSVAVSGEHFFTETITYDNNDRITNIHWLFTDDNSTSETVYTYEENQITETYYSDGEKLHYFVSGYNSDGYLVHYIAYSAENEIRRMIKFEYDEYNNVCKIQRMSGDEVENLYSPEKNYDEKGNILSEIYYSNVDYFSNSMLELYKMIY